MFLYLDVSDFPKDVNFHCTSHYQNESSLVLAIMQCREDVNCSMVSASRCDNETSMYYLCRNPPELRAEDGACSFRKPGT